MTLSSLAPNSTSELNVFGHNSDSLGMNCTKIGVLENTHQISLRGLLKSGHSTTLEAKVSLEVLGDFPHQSLKWKLPDKKLCTLLVFPDFSKSHSSWPETVGFLYSSGGGSWLPSGLCCQLFPRCLTSGGFTSGLLSTSYFEYEKMRVSTIK